MSWYLAVLKKYADFSGRARRKEYWMFFLVNFLVYVVLSIIAMMSIEMALVMSLIQLLYYLAVLIPSIAVGVRRMHDTGRSGWWLLVPIANLIFALTAGTTGDNEYGPDPKA
ncbi:MAG: DUF805 domain-containing protein [Ignavibacteriae bacterium]|nr:DUF805 domain-containing protein [Ignavibacteriota bacterium]